MSRKDYTKFAKMFNELLSLDVQVYAKYAGGYMAKDMFDAMVKATANLFEDDNNRFDRQRFMDAVYKDAK